MAVRIDVGERLISKQRSSVIITYDDIFTDTLEGSILCEVLLVEDATGAAYSLYDHITSSGCDEWSNDDDDCVIVALQRFFEQLYFNKYNEAMIYPC